MPLIVPLFVSGAASFGRKIAGQVVISALGSVCLAALTAALPDGPVRGLAFWTNETSSVARTAEAPIYDASGKIVDRLHGAPSATPPLANLRSPTVLSGLLDVPLYEGSDGLSSRSTLRGPGPMAPSVAELTVPGETPTPSRRTSPSAPARLAMTRPAAPASPAALPLPPRRPATVALASVDQPLPPIDVQHQPASEPSRLLGLTLPRLAPPEALISTMAAWRGSLASIASQWM